MSDKSWRSQRKIVTMPGSRSTTPEVVLARTLEKARAGHIKGILIGIIWEDGGCSSDFSVMKVSEAIYALRVVSKDIDDIIFAEDNLKPVDDLRE